MAKMAASTFHLPSSSSPCSFSTVADSLLHTQSHAHVLLRPLNSVRLPSKCPFLGAFLSFKSLSPSAPLQLQHPLPPAPAFSAMASTDVDFSPEPAQADARLCSGKGSLLALTWSFGDLTVDIRERVAIPEAERLGAEEELVAAEFPHVMEAGILSTCNRLEVYVVAVSCEMGVKEVIRWMCGRSGVAERVLRESVRVVAREEEAARHLFRVASGLESMVVGEGQILGQLKRTLEIHHHHHQQQGGGGGGCGCGCSSTSGKSTTKNMKAFGKQVRGLFERAVLAGKRARSESGIGVGAVSISSAAVELVYQKGLLPLPLHGQQQQEEETWAPPRRLLVVGAGEMAKLLLHHLLSKFSSPSSSLLHITVVNRSEARVAELRSRFPSASIEFKPLEELGACIEESDLVFTCTGSDVPLITKDTIRSARLSLPFPAAAPSSPKKHFVDISVPRNVCPSVAEMDGCVVHNIDDLQEVVAKNKTERVERAMRAEQVVEEEVRKFMTWKESVQTVVPTIKKLRAYGERIRAQEVDKCVAKMGDGVSERDKRLIQKLSRTIVNKLLHGPMAHLRQRRRRRQHGEEEEEEEEAMTMENMRALERMFDLQQLHVNVTDASGGDDVVVNHPSIH